MRWLDRFLGPKEPPATATTGSQQLPNSPGDSDPFREHIRYNLELLEFLSTCGTFDLERWQQYISRRAHLGRPLDADKVRDLQSSIPTIGGLEALRTDNLIPTHLRAFETFNKSANENDPATLKFLREARKRFGEVRAKLAVIPGATFGFRCQNCGAVVFDLDNALMCKACQASQGIAAKRRSLATAQKTKGVLNPKCGKCGLEEAEIIRRMEELDKRRGMVLYATDWPVLLYCQYCDEYFCGGCQVDLGVHSGCPVCRADLMRPDVDFR